MPGSVPPRTGASMWLPLVLLLVLGAIWGGNPAFSKALVTNGISPPAVVFWQTLGAGVLLSIVCLVRRTPIRLNRRAVIYYPTSSCVSFVISYELPVQYEGLGVMAEHNWTRGAGQASLFDVSHMGQVSK